MISFGVFATRNIRLFLYVFTCINSLTYFPSFHSLNDKFCISYFFVLYCKGESFSYFREKLPSISCNFFNRNSAKNIIHILIYFNNFPLIPFIKTPLPPHLFSSTSMIKDKRVLRFCAKSQYKFFTINFSINISVFVSYKKCIPLNILKFLKGKFNHMKW